MCALCARARVRTRVRTRVRARVRTRVRTRVHDGADSTYRVEGLIELAKAMQPSLPMLLFDRSTCHVESDGDDGGGMVVV